MERHEFLEILTEQIRTKRARPFIAKEIEGHIEDQKMDFMAEGMTDLEAEEAAVREMGDPVEAGVALDRIHRPRMKWSVLTGILLISILGLILQMTVTMTACEAGFFGSLLLSAGGGGRHLTAMAAGIALMLCICWADYTLLNKYAVILWAAVNGLLILCAVESPLINGRPFYLTHASCLIIPFYAGMLYHFRGQGSKGIIKSILCLCIPMAVLFHYRMLSCIIIIGAAGMILLHAAVWRKWFGEKRLTLYLQLWGFSIILVLLMLAAIAFITRGKILADYQLERLAAWLSPKKYEGSYFL